jgi:hypothetical protein
MAKNMAKDHLLNIMMDPFFDYLSVDGSRVPKLTVTHVKTIPFRKNVLQDYSCAKSSEYRPG